MGGGIDGGIASRAARTVLLGQFPLSTPRDTSGLVNASSMTRRGSWLAGRSLPRPGELAASLGLDGGVVLAFVVSRLIVLAAVFVAEGLLPRNPALTSGDAAPILRSLTSWDGWYYLGIVREGYHVDPVAGAYRDVAFLPLFPVVVRVLSAPIPQLAGLVAVVVSNVAFLLSLGLLVRLGELYLGRRRAVLAAGLLAIYPFASAFAMAYTESLFLLTMIAAFLAAERGRAAWAGVFLALACLARLQGIALIVPLWLILLRRDGWRPKPGHAWLLLGPLAAAGYLLYVGWLSGSLTGFLDAQRAWGREGLGGAAPGGAIRDRLTAYQGALVLTLCWSVFMLVWVRRDRLRLEYALVPMLFIAAEMASGSLEAVGRVTMLAFPYCWLLARRRSLLGRRGWPVVSAALFAVVAVLSFGGYWVP
jgi:hypothetical protein